MTLTCLKSLKVQTLALSLLALQACVSAEQPAAQEAVIVPAEEASSLPPEDGITADAGSMADPALAAETSAADIPAEAPTPVEAPAVDRQRVHFETARWDLDSSALASIDAMSQRLKAEPSLKLRLEGHCDERGTDGYNMDLSQKRAQSVRDALVERGVESDRLSTKGFGRSRLLVPGTSDSERAQNRRVEMMEMTAH